LKFEGSISRQDEVKGGEGQYEISILNPKDSIFQYMRKVKANGIKNIISKNQSAKISKTGLTQKPKSHLRMSFYPCSFFNKFDFIFLG